jgi:nucleoside-diphosphate-sugar epimerase
VILVTGATGFVGKAVLQHLLATDEIQRVAVAVRGSGEEWPDRVLQYVVGDLASSTDWSMALTGVSSVVHCAARVHVMNEKAENPIHEFRSINVQGTLNLARQAAASGVRRFVFISSIKVNGEGTYEGAPFKADDMPAPVDPYGISKMEAEQGLREIAAFSAMEVVIIRPPLVYGPGVKGNFAALMRLLRRGVPLPLGAIHNKRSLVALYNLVDLIVVCLTHPAAANQTFLVSDNEDISTTELLCRLGRIIDSRTFLIPVPASCLKLGALLGGKRNVAQRLCGSLQVDIEKTCQLLGWHPPITLTQGLKKVVEGISA